MSSLRVNPLTKEQFVAAAIQQARSLGSNYSAARAADDYALYLATAELFGTHYLMAERDLDGGLRLLVGAPVLQR
jgi:hypothetical protein